jgi:hypothetical protein
LLVVLPFEARAADGFWIEDGSEFRVNTYTLGDQHETGPFAIAPSRANGRFVVVWQSEGQDGDRSGVYAQVYDYEGVALGSELRVNGRTTGRQFHPAVAMHANGDFVVAWASDTSGRTQLFARRFAESGAPRGPQFRVNADVDGVDFYPSVAVLPSGGFVVAWEALEEIPLSYDVFARRFDTSGAPIDDEFRVSSAPGGANRRPAISSSDAGDFVVAWSSRSIDGDGYGIAARRFRVDGQANGDELPVNTTTTGEQDEPDVAMHHDASFVVVWTALDGGDPDSTDIFGRDFDENAVPRESEFVVNPESAGRQDHPAVASEHGYDGYPGAGYFVAWEDEDSDGSGIVAQSFLNLGGAFRETFGVNTRTTGDQTRPAVAAGYGSFVIAWTSDAPQWKSGSNVLAQRYRLCCTSTHTTETTMTTQTTYTTQTTGVTLTTTTLSQPPGCAQPLTSGPTPSAQDCAYILQVAVGLATCSPECICAPAGALPTTAADALLCLSLAVETPGVEAQCPCQEIAH